jgi:hypothetical protein
LSATEAPASTSTLLAGYRAPSGIHIELRKNEHGYFTYSKSPDGSGTLIYITCHEALEAYQLAVREGTAWGWQ